MALMAKSACAWQVVPGLSGKHPLTQAQVGEVLIGELRCAACHGGIEPQSVLAKSAPELLDVGARISPDYLKRFLASPSTTQPGTTMPDMLASKSEAERATIAEALTHFLVAQSQQVYQHASPELLSVAEGKALFHSVGCVACHGPRETLGEEFLFRKPKDLTDDEDDDDDEKSDKSEVVRPIGVNLGHVPSKYGSKSLSEFLYQPLRVRSSGRMPDMKLTQVESLAIAGYLLGEQTGSREALKPLDPLVAMGKMYFQELNCAACHTVKGIPSAAPIASLKNADPNQGCLSKTIGKHPQFQLQETQLLAITAAIREEPHAESDAIQTAKTLTTFNCIGCHIRDDYGGVPEDYDPFFLTSEKNLGDDGRIPPPLTVVGAMLQPAWLKKVDFEGEIVRPYKSVSMQHFGAANLHHLPELRARTDRLESRQMKIPSPEGRSDEEREHEKLLRKAGQELLGDKGLNCINCHNFNGKPSPVNTCMAPRVKGAYFKCSEKMRFF